jgi:hypothetical protein
VLAPYSSATEIPSEAERRWKKRARIGGVMP